MTNCSANTDFSLQDMLIAHIRNDLVGQGWSLLKTGQRSGKTHIAHKVAQTGRYENVVLITGHDPITKAQEFSQQVPDVYIHSDFDEIDGLPGPILVVFDEAMWVENSYLTFCRLEDNRRFHILVVSSNGPEFAKGWNMVPGRSFNTWDLNPGVDIKDVLTNTNDLEKAVRDYCAY